MSECALYRHFDSEGRLLYVGTSLNALARLIGHRQTARWFREIATMTVEHFPSQREALAAEIKAIETERPLHNKAHNNADGAPISDREADVLRMMAEGKSVSQIARALNLSIKTVTEYKSRLAGKLGARRNGKATLLSLHAWSIGLKAAP